MFSGSFVDPYHEIDSFDQGEVRFNITSEVNCDLKGKSMMMIMMENSFLGLLPLAMVQNKEMMKRLKTINFSVDFMFTETVMRL